MRVRQRFAAADALAALGSVSGNLTHRINNTVGGIRVLSKMLANKLGSTSPELVAIAQDIHNAATETLDVVGHYGEVFRLDTKLLNVADVIRQAIGGIRVPEGIDLVLDLPERALVVMASDGAFTEIIGELVRNALKSLGTHGAITVRASSDEFHICVSIWDNGSPISPEKASQLFERRYSDRSGSVGTGFGLWWIQRFMSKLGGGIVYRPGDPTGNTFRLLFPIPPPAPIVDKNDDQS